MTRTRLATALVSVIAATTVLVADQAPVAQVAQAAKIAASLRDRIQQDGHVRVIVELNARGAAEGRLASAAAVVRQRQTIADARQRLLSRLPATAHRLIHQFQTVPFVALDVDTSGLDALEADPDVARVVEDAVLRPVLADSVPLVQGDQAWDVGFDGTGTTVAILDTGVDSTHPFLTGKVVEEACYSSTQAGTSVSLCPNGADEQIGPGAGAPCGLPDCVHGTHVAGIAAGNGASGGVPFSGVAKGATLMAVQVFSEVTSAAACGGFAPCAGAYTSDMIAGLERVYAVAAQHNIVSVNMSLGGATFAANCDSDPAKPMIDNLRSIGVATVIAAGNDGATDQLSTPACISTAVSVGSVEKDDTVSFFSNAATFMSIFAPGGSITSSIPGGDYATFSGTSMAAPHVAGTWAILRQAVPSGSVTDLLQALRATGLPITDMRLGGTVTIPRERIFQALSSLAEVTNPAPQATALTPSRTRVNTTFTLTVSGSHFNAFSRIRWNGADVASTVINTQSIQASIPGSLAPAVGTAAITVFTPTPGGGETVPLTLSIDPPPTLTLSATAVGLGGSETVTLANGFGNQQDWIALAATGSPDTSYLQWTFVGNGVLNRDWTIAMPATAGTYEFRLFLNNGFTRAATSATVTVDPSIAPAPSVTSLVPAATPVGGPAFTLRVLGDRFVASSVVRWNGNSRPTTFVSATEVQAAIPATDIAALGSAQISVFNPAPGGGTSSSLTFSVVPKPSLAISAASVQSSATETVTLTNGLGGNGDWIALASTTAPDTSYLQFVYVGAGVSTRTWTVTMPATPGTYEFRLFLNNGYTRAATSPTVTVTPGPNPVPNIASISPAQTYAGGSAFTLTVNGTSFVSASTVQWNGSARPTTFVSSSQLTAAIGAADVAAIGTPLVTVFSPTPGGGTSSALPFNVTPPPSIAISAASIPGSGSETMTLTNGAGGAYDWLALAATTAPNTSYLQYTFVGTGVTTRTWTVTMPTTPGTYEFRLFLNNGYTRIATSPPITVTGTNPVPTIGSLSPASTAVGSAPFTLTVNGTNFVSSSVVQWNGSPRPTTFASATRLTASIAAADVAAVGTSQVTVFSPAPGGGTSASFTFTTTPPPSLTISAATVEGGASETVTLVNGLGGGLDWLALAATNAPNNSYLQFVYVGSGVTTRTWTVTMPLAAGTYEFRLFLNNGYTRAATSPPITVTPGPNPVPSVSSLSPSAAAVGSAGFTLTVNGSGFVPASVVRWNGSARTTTFVSTTQITAAIGAADVASVGSALVDVFSPTPGGGTSSSLTFAINPPPSITVNTTTVAPGGSVTMTLTNGPGGPFDWLALAATGALSNNYLQYVYVGSGVTTRTWTVTMPTTPGTYEFRLFLNNGYVRAATSPTVTVTP